MIQLKDLSIQDLHSLLPGFTLYEFEGLNPDISNGKYQIEKIYDYFIIAYNYGDRGLNMIGRVDTLEQIKEIISK